MEFTSNNRFQNMFVYQPTLDMLELSKDKATVMFLVWNQRVYPSKLKSLFTAFLHSIKLSGYRMRIKLNKHS